MVGGNYVNRFNIGGRSNKVIPQIQRMDRLNPDQLRNIYVTGGRGQLVPLSTIATTKNSTVPRSLNRFQQLNAVKISGVAVRPLDEALRFLEGEAAKILPKGYVPDYTGESRQLRTEGNAFVQAFGLAVILIFLMLAAQFNSFRNPFVILAGHFPLTLVTGAWAVARNSIGLILLGGMAISTLFTLFVILSIKMLIAKNHARDREIATEDQQLIPAGQAEPEGGWKN